MYKIYFPGMDLYEEFFGVIRAFNAKRIRYAVIGGLAMGFYDLPRFTRDIDVLIPESQFDRVKAIVCSLRYDETAQPWRFSATNITLHRFVKIEGNDVVPLDVLAGGGKFHENVIKRALRAKSGQGIVRIARKGDLIRLKSFRNSDQDRIDIKRLRASS